MSRPHELLPTANTQSGTSGVCGWQAEIRRYQGNAVPGHPLRELIMPIRCLRRGTPKECPQSSGASVSPCIRVQRKQECHDSCTHLLECTEGRIPSKNLKSPSSDTGSRSEGSPRLWCPSRNTPRRRSNCLPKPSCVGTPPKRNAARARPNQTSCGHHKHKGNRQVAVKHSRRKKRWNRATHMTGKRRQGETRGKTA